MPKQPYGDTASVIVSKSIDTIENLKEYVSDAWSLSAMSSETHDEITRVLNNHLEALTALLCKV